MTRGCQDSGHPGAEERIVVTSALPLQITKLQLAEVLEVECWLAGSTGKVRVQVSIHVLFF